MPCEYCNRPRTILYCNMCQIEACEECLETSVHLDRCHICATCDAKRGENQCDGCGEWCCAQCDYDHTPAVCELEQQRIRLRQEALDQAKHYEKALL